VANLIPLIDNALAGQDYGEKGTLMIVGDPNNHLPLAGGRRSVYRTHEDNNNPFANPDKKLEHLDKNYRSYSQVIEFNNEFFQVVVIRI
jgi:DNA helicase IV